MREIKFRAWDEGNKVMHVDFQFIRSGVEGNDWIIFISDKFPLENHETNPFKNPSPYFAQQLKVMQYTGLKDKTGKEIYEGDLIHSEATICMIVEFKKGAFGIGNIFPFKTLQSAIRNYGEVEIVGNIYENSELKDDSPTDGH